jgi:PTH1 family peptidyl-tRNA hydrolase
LAFFRKPPVDTNQWLVVGLGNPGPGYAGNRHNVGDMVVTELARRVSATFKSSRSNALVAEGRSGVGADAPRFILAKPLSFMNLSGGPTSSLLKYYKLDATRLIVVHDELDIPFDTVRLKLGGGNGGHNGIRDITSALGSPDYIRVRVGIGRPPGRMDAAAFVLQNFSGSERETLPNLISDAADAVELIATAGLTAAQLKVHTHTSD